MYLSQVLITGGDFVLVPLLCRRSFLFSISLHVVTQKTITDTHPNTQTLGSYLQLTLSPALFVCWAPPDSIISDRCTVKPGHTVGRSSTCALAVRDRRLSKQHFKITKQGESHFIEDLGSTNDTCLNGEKLTKRVPLPDRSIIRAGNSIFVFYAQGSMLLAPPPEDRFSMAGKFHVGHIISLLQEAAASKRHVLLYGTSGSGKELAAKAITIMSSPKDNPLHMVSHNAAKFSSEEEASSTLFGVAAKVFSNVDARLGLIEQANNGVLFLDEIHNLPIRVQRTLLRVMEDGEFSRIGEAQKRRVTVRFVLASNAEGASKGLAPDLYARCREVSIPPLHERPADIPSIFLSILAQAADHYHLNPDHILPHIKCDYIEAMCMDGFEDSNVRGIIDLCDRIVTRISCGTSPKQAVTSVFCERFELSQSGGSSPRSAMASVEQKGDSHYDKYKESIVSAFHATKGNFSAMERTLRNEGISCSRRWLKIYADKWGLSKPLKR